MGIILREGRRLTAQCLYFVNLYPETQEGSYRGQSMSGWSSEKWWGIEPGDPRQGWDCNTGATVRIRINSWRKESSWLVSMRGVSDPENQKFEMGMFEINVDVYVLLM